MLGSADSLQGRNDLLAGLIVTAVESGLADTLTGVLQALAPEADVFADADAASKLEPWRVEAIASMFEALERRRQRLGTSELKLGEGAEVPVRLIESVKRRACKLAMEPAAAEPLRLACIRLLGVWGHTIALEVLSSGVLDPRTPLPLQLAAVDALARSRERDAGPLLLRRWPTLSPMVRGRVIDALLGREEWSRELLSEVERGHVSVGEVSLPQRQRLLAVKNSSQRERAARLFAATSGASRTDVLAKYSGVADLAAALSRGAALFDTHCAQCHAWRGHGHTVGPNLAEFAGKSAADFVQAILDPNSAINPNFLAYNIETKDGRSLSGIVRGETASGLTLVQGGGVQEQILRADIQEIRASNLSLMPEGLEQALTPQDLADLIAWIKQAAPAPFGHASASPDLAAKNRADFLKSGANSVAKITTSTETLPYRSWVGTLPMAYCRQSAGVNRLAWESTPERPLTPALSPSEGERENRGAAGGRMADFRFPAAMGFLSQPSGKFALRINGTALFDFNVSLADETWQSPDGRARMSYTVTEANTEDSCGVLRIEVATDLMKPGEPARFEVIGSDSGSQRWFGIYEFNIRR